ncbi:MAG TPA: pseudouridine synthase [Povalibacter sp.]|uniref:pseudouridine synthase n=1 Tax=Povalibacter sp. TaxID=1962978 RepID=UPI002CABF9F5|nr:pseudouridine synthase [Povalibacter sp.]HMN43981.1 pseudouridine synthase [Povalibacter sp.]
MHPFVCVTAHHPAALADLKDRRAALLSLCRQGHLKGSILLTPEGISLSVAGETEATEQLIEQLRRWPGLEDLQPQVAGIEHQPFVRMSIRVKKELRAPDLESTDAPWIQCTNCRHVLTAEDRQHERYEAGRHCPYCCGIDANDMAKRIAIRHEQIERLIHPLPGSVPHDHFRPVTIPAACDGLTLLDALCRIVSHIPANFWQERCDKGLLLDSAERPAPAATRVRAGERYLHRFPGVIEPDVDMRIELLHEDEALLVINKPAPLPMHAGGRFNRNTLKYILDALYHPQTPRPAHRLDANTTGALVVSRTRHIAGKIQAQFARGEVEKNYLVCVHGHPAANEFVCAAPISADAGHAGSRVIDAASGLPARTEFQVLQRLDDGTSLLEARPLTGRTNQIRVHLWHLGFPVCGDPVYLRGDELGDSQTLPVDAAPLCLHAWRIRFRHPLQRKLCEFTAAPPVWFVSSLPVGPA